MVPAPAIDHGLFMLLRLRRDHSATSFGRQIWQAASVSLSLLAASKSKLSRYRQFEELAAQKPRREKQDL